jgi:hypothetical protein
LEKGNSVGIVVGDHILKISVLPKTWLDTSVRK